VDARRDVDFDSTFLDDAAGTVAHRAGRFDLLAGSPACRASLRPHELAEDAARDLLQTACTVASRAGRDLRSRLGAVAAAVRAGHRNPERDFPLHAARCVDELDLDLGGEIGPA
jgi:hypothetical protein